MGLFDFFKKNDLDLIEWQNIIQRGEYDRLIMSKEQLYHATHNTYLPNVLRIIDDCVNLVNNTKTPDVYFYRLELLVEHLDELSKLEKFISFKSPLPSIQLDEVLSHKELLNEQFIDRCWENTLESANKLKTEKGKQNKINKFFEIILSYKEYLTSANLEYINNLKIEKQDA